MRDFHLPGRSAVYATNGMCATSHPLAATAALDILKSGGNAVDAAIAGAVLLGICEPQMTGLGGDMFALIQKDPSADVVALNGSGRAPQAANATALRAKGLSTIPLHSAEGHYSSRRSGRILPHGRGFREPKFGRHIGPCYSLRPHWCSSGTKGRL